MLRVLEDEGFEAAEDYGVCFFQYIGRKVRVIWWEGHTVCDDDGVSAGDGFVGDGFGEVGGEEDCVFELGVGVVG